MGKFPLIFKHYHALHFYHFFFFTCLLFLLNSRVNKCCVKIVLSSHRLKECIFCHFISWDTSTILHVDTCRRMQRRSWGLSGDGAEGWVQLLDDGLWILAVLSSGAWVSRFAVRQLGQTFRLYVTWSILYLDWSIRRVQSLFWQLFQGTKSSLVMASWNGAPNAVEGHLHRWEGQVGHELFVSLPIWVLHLEALNVG